MITAERKAELVKQAGEEFQKRSVCSEAILNTFNQGLDLGLNETAIKMASPMAGYGNRCCCGALNGAEMVIGALTGRSSDNTDFNDFVKSFDFAKEMHDSFSKVFGASCCKIITRNQNFGTPEHMESCKHLVEDTAGLLVDVINNNKIA